MSLLVDLNVFLSDKQQVKRQCLRYEIIENFVIQSLAIQIRHTVTHFTQVIYCESSTDAGRSSVHAIYRQLFACRYGFDCSELVGADVIHVDEKLTPPCS